MNKQIPIETFDYGFTVVINFIERVVDEIGPGLFLCDTVRVGANGSTQSCVTLNDKTILLCDDCPQAQVWAKLLNEHFA